MVPGTSFRNVLEYLSIVDGQAGRSELLLTAMLVPIVSYAYRVWYIVLAGTGAV